MLKTTAISQANKTAGCAVTYRAGTGDKFGTCPADCRLNASGRGCDGDQIDFEYLDILADAVPRRGVSFTYSHFEPFYWMHKLAAGKTVINYSADSPFIAYQAVRSAVQDVKLVRCPAEYNSAVTCNNCGDGRPLCARLDRDYIITFTAHGAGKRKINDGQRGGCYADGGNVNIHWQHTAKQEQSQTDGERLKAFVKTLPTGSILRHHVAGDIGKEKLTEKYDLKPVKIKRGLFHT